MTLLTEPPSVDGVIAAAQIRPVFNHNTELVGVLQWCSGPNVPVKVGESESVVFTLLARLKGQPAKSSQKFHFRAVKHSLSLMDCSKRAGDAAVLAAFMTLCQNNKIVMVYDTPFLDLMGNSEFQQSIIDQITKQFNVLHEGIM